LQERKKSSQGNGIGKSIANFFKNIGHREETRLLSASGDRPKSRRQGLESGTQHLPRIITDSATSSADGNPSPQPHISSQHTSSPSPDAQSPMIIEQQEMQIENQRMELLQKKLDELK